jgi:hypothetical protein
MGRVGADSGSGITESEVGGSEIALSEVGESTISPSARNSAAMCVHTRGGGSSVAANCLAALEISFRSETRSAQAGQDFK